MSPDTPRELKLEVKSTRSGSYSISERDLEGIQNGGHLCALITERQYRGPRWALVPSARVREGSLSQDEIIQLEEEGPLIEMLQAGWSRWMLDRDALDCLLAEGPEGLRDRLQWCRKHYTPREPSGPAVLQETRLAQALNELRERLDQLATGESGPRLEGHLHQILLEDAVRQGGYRLTSNPIGVPDITAVLE